MHTSIGRREPRTRLTFGHKRRCNSSRVSACLFKLSNKIILLKNYDKTNRSQQVNRWQTVLPCPKSCRFKKDSFRLKDAQPNHPAQLTSRTRVSICWCQTIRMSRLTLFCTLVILQIENNRILSSRILKNKLLASF